MLLLVVRKLDGRYQVTGVREFQIDVNYHPDHHRECTQDVADYVTTTLETNQIFFPDRPNIDQPQITDFDLEPVDPVENLRANALNFLRTGELEKSLDSDFYLSFLEFIQLNNYMCSKGYFFTDENREELYLTILNTADPVLIAKLEDYLLAFDELNRFNSPIEDYRASRKAMNEMTSEAEVRTYFRNKTGREIADIFNN